MTSILAQRMFQNSGRGCGTVLSRAFSANFDTIGSHQFCKNKLKAAISDDTFNAFTNSIQNGTNLDKGQRNEIAAAMVNFAIGLGATSYCHKFYPLRYHDAKANAGGKMDLFVDLDFGNSDTLKPIL